MIDTLLLQDLTDECRAWVRLHERFAALEDAGEREEMYQREMFGLAQRIGVPSLELTKDDERLENA